MAKQSTRATVTVWDGGGIERLVRPIDAAEIVASGGSWSNPKGKTVEVPDDEKRADGTPCETYTEADVAAQMPKAKKK